MNINILLDIHESVHRDTIIMQDTSRQQLVWILPGTVNTVKCSWWWVKTSSETCRADLYSCILLITFIIMTFYCLQQNILRTPPAQVFSKKPPFREILSTSSVPISRKIRFGTPNIPVFPAHKHKTFVTMRISILAYRRQETSLTGAEQPSPSH